MFDILWKNINVATIKAGEGYGIINNAALGIADGKISYVGPAADFPAREIRDGNGAWVTPAFIDCHTHLVYAGNRAAEFEQRLHGASYAEIAKSGGGILSTVRATRAASEDELTAAALRRLDVLRKDGICALEIKSGYGLDLETERKMLRVATRLRDETGLRIQRTFLGAHALPPGTDADTYIDDVCAMLSRLHAEALVDAVDGFCENIAFTPAQIEKVFGAAKALGLPVKLHAEQLSNQHGAALAARYGALSADHVEYIDEDGVRAMAAAGTVAVLLPGAFYFLREKQVPPVDLFRKHGVPMALATDHNPGTAPVLSLVLMLNMACTLFRFTPEEALAGVTRHAAQALGYDDLGTLEAGKTAALAFWEIGHPRDLCAAMGGTQARLAGFF